MALHGDLNEIGLEEVVSLVGGRSGVLSLGPVQGKTLLIQVAAGLVASFSIENRITDKERILKAARWFAENPSDFSFEQKPIYAVQATHLELPQLFQHRKPVHSEFAERELTELSDPGTVFMLIRAKKVDLPLQLQRFLERTSPMLEKGANAHDIARRTQMPLEDVQLALHALKQARKAWPAFIAPPPSRDSGSGLFSWLLRPRAARLARG
jgi:hypothetical protein